MGCFWYLHSGPAYRSIWGEKSMSEPQPTISSNKTHRCLMITLCYQTQPLLTRTRAQTQSTSLSLPQPIVCIAISPLTVCVWAAKRFINTSKWVERTISPAASVWEDFYGNVQVGDVRDLGNAALKGSESLLNSTVFSSLLIWNWISCVICIHVLSLAIQFNPHKLPVFITKCGSEETRMRWEVGNISKAKTTTDILYHLLFIRFYTSS